MWSQGELTARKIMQRNLERALVFIRGLRLVLHLAPGRLENCFALTNIALYRLAWTSTMALQRLAWTSSRVMNRPHHVNGQKFHFHSRDNPRNPRKVSMGGIIITPRITAMFN